MGVPQMIALLAFLAFAVRLGFLGAAIGLVAACLVYLIIGAAITMGKRY